MTIEDYNICDEQDRFIKLEKSIKAYEMAKGSIKTGIEDFEIVEAQKQKILKKLRGTEEDWKDYKWQLNSRFDSVEDISDILNLTDDEKEKMKVVGDKFRFAISPYYMSVINPNDPNCPVRKQSIPCGEELDESGVLDPMDEAGWSPEELVTRRYPDRLIIKVTNMCGMYCRFCQRRRMIGEHDVNAPKDKIKKAIDYVRNHPEVRDVLVTGGDSFMLSDSMIDWLLSELRSIEHVEIIRFGTRTPVTLPQRITPELVEILKKYHPIYVNTHFNSQREITEESKKACELLANAGIPLGNQMVLLNGVNNDPHTVRKLNQSLLRIRVKPYYIFHPKTVKGTSHFWVNLEEGMEIMETLRGRTSGLAIPTYIVNGSKGLGKTPVLPNYLLYIGKEKAVLRNWEGLPFEIDNKK
ncbi:KamA family radical SAM protein [Alkalibacter saccharofermentans]|uniref:Glutamate 2,3-aminomutase n=1 Tax=Alkalibacter saccharofermentans DSM 14828 TaxID=1120975 RepID=A0A1M4YVC5_9FIRM|nr:KamA family radical SAM protein [Alkalibacter saccharofermentans]SHF09442.1 glutamate 2,3-aminomutase [Alkalibacter saccharofermentans DSM 14828]